MTSIDSIVPEITQLVFEPLPPGKPVAGKLCRIDHVIVVITEKGTIYSSEVSNRCHYLRGAGRFTLTFKALYKLGRVTKAQMDTHLSDIAAIRQKDIDSYSAQTMLKYANELGIKLTNAQKGRLARIQEGGSR